MMASRISVVAVGVALSACTPGGTEPSANSVRFDLYPSKVGTQWWYASRDTAIRGLSRTPFIVQHVVTHSKDTTVAGRQYVVLDNGSAAFDGLPGTRSLVRNGTDGLHRLIPILDSWYTPFSVAFPNTVGATGLGWTLVALNDSIRTPAGMYVALHYTSVLSGTLRNHLWLAPGVGVVRSLTGLMTSGPQDSVRYVLELTRMQ